MTKLLEKFVLYLNRRFGLTPNALTYARIFSAPWLALLVSETLSKKSLALTLVVVFFYFMVTVTDLLDGILARAISLERTHDHFQGGMLDRVADKALIIALLIPFGLNLLTFSIILGESLLLYQVIFARGAKKQATRAGKAKMLLQTFLIPILFFEYTLGIVPDAFFYAYLLATIAATFASVYSHYFAS